ncbi:hypothetical protein [Streptomyces caniscabiei]|uniref:hypothetical protein n=1 Tax=Streptomyces caniscabiei TaxID=2746961 RepID=UPI001872994C|nr:hypothetical protein [Streptomyces caniscabiei]MBE4789956.1 hypothetical protein [Streptomyces caniscabiei]MBE4790855.1 hypothetical protein [Streptomyces caniscabiei]
MGYELYREVKVWAPPSLTHREKLTAMVLADDANDRTRLTYSSVVDPEIMRQAMVPDDRSMRRIIAKLKEEKVLEHVGGGHNGRTAKYRFLHLAPAGSGITLPGENDPATADVGGSESPSYESEPDEKAGENDPPSDGVGGSFSASSRVKKTPPTPSPPTTSSSTTPTDKSASGQRKPSKHQVADDLTAAFWEHHGKGRAQPFLAVRGVIRTAIGNGVDRDDLARALDQVAREGRSISGATLDIALGNLRRGAYQNPDDQDVYDEDLI